MYKFTIESLKGVGWRRNENLSQTREFTEPAGEESLVMNSELEVLGFLCEDCMAKTKI